MNIRDSRSLFGAAALLIVGAILSSMTYQYFAGQYTGEGIVRSRSWWEIVMNLQILALAFMWFCYADRIREADKMQAWVMKCRMGFGLLAISVPFVVALISAFMGWFENRPSTSIVDLIVCHMIIFWAVSSIIPRMVAMRSKKLPVTFGSLWESMKPPSVWFVAPAFTGLAVVLFDVALGTEYYYLSLPILLYGQAAMPFIYRGFGWELRRALA